MVKIFGVNVALPHFDHGAVEIEGRLASGLPFGRVWS
jgi:hypothetical protein